MPEQPVDKPKVFISYSRSDSSALAAELLVGLELVGFDAYLDKHDIEKAVDWEDRLRDLILKSDTVVFIISPGSVKSERCQWEVERAAALGKRLIPVQLHKVPEADVPPRLRRLNYIFFSEEQTYSQSLSELTTALRQDIPWIRMHTQIGEQAARWKLREGLSEDLVLRGAELAEARDWITSRKMDAPEITALQKEFLSASEAAEIARKRRSLRSKALLTTLSTAIIAVAIGWWQEVWVREQYFRLVHVQGVLKPAQERGLTPGSEPFQECAVCPIMKVVPAGTFQIGSPAGVGEPNELPQRQIVLKAPFAVGSFEVTFEEWDACASYGNCRKVDSGEWGRGRQPVINVSWDDATRYTSWLSRMTGKTYRLLTEAEWEYAARAGNSGYFHFGNDDVTHLGAYAWSALNADRRTHPVGRKRPNPFGLHDVYGNVKEWVQDCWHDNYREAREDGAARLDGNCSRRTVRGGSWLYRSKALRSASREWLPIDSRRDDLGFRVAREIAR